jgi:plasmid stabilization system protein ParE
MALTVSFARAAARDLKRLDIVLSKKAARRMKGRIGDVIALLQERPLAGTELGKGRPWTFAVTGTPYILVYRPQRDTVRILRVLHSRQDRPPITP